MLFRKRFLDGIADGSVTVAYRRWERSRVVAGRSRRTRAGVIDVGSVREVELGSIVDADAHSAGYASAEELRASLGGREGMPVFRIEFRLAEGPDPRAELAARSELTLASGR